MIRRMMLLFLAFLLVFGSACASVQLEFWACSSKHADEMCDAAERWNLSQPNRAITLHITVFPKDMIHERMWTMLHSGVLLPGLEYPDFADIEYQNVPDYINPLNLQLYPINEVVGDDPGVAYDAYSYQNMYIGIPLDEGCVAAVYNTDALREAGVDPERISTWEDFIQAGKQYADATGKRMLAVDMDHYMAFLTLYLQIAAGGSEDVYTDTLEMLAELIRADVAAFMPGGRSDSRSFAEAFGSGEFAAFFARRVDLNEIEMPEGAYIAKLPVLNDENGVWIPGYATCVTTHCKDYALVIDFLRFASERIEIPDEGILCPGNADQVQKAIRSYKLDLAKLVLDGGTAE